MNTLQRDVLTAASSCMNKSMHISRGAERTIPTTDHATHSRPKALRFKRAYAMARGRACGTPEAHDSEPRSQWHLTVLTFVAPAGSDFRSNPHAAFATLSGMHTPAVAAFSVQPDLACSAVLTEAESGKNCSVF